MLARTRVLAAEQSHQRPDATVLRNGQPIDCMVRERPERTCRLGLCLCGFGAREEFDEWCDRTSIRHLLGQRRLLLLVLSRVAALPNALGCRLIAPLGLVLIHLRLHECLGSGGGDFDSIFRGEARMRRGRVPFGLDTLWLAGRLLPEQGHER